MKINVQNTSLEITAGLPEQFPINNLPRIAFSGRSNVGKSSLVNTLLSRKSLARVSSAPGKTITVNFYNVDKKIYLVDLPGYGFAKRNPEDVKKWSKLTDGFFTDEDSRKNICCVVQLIDIKAGITADDETMLDYMNQSGVDYIIAVTKCDKLNKTMTEKSLSEIRDNPLVSENCRIIPFSSLKQTGKNELWDCIFNKLKEN